MPITTPIRTRFDVIRLISDIRFELIMWLSTLDSTHPQYQLLDDYSEELNRLQRDLIRTILIEGTKTFKRHTKSLEKHNKNLLQTIGRLNKIAETLETLDKFIGVVEKLLKLAVPSLVVASPVAYATMEKKAASKSYKKTLHGVEELIHDSLVEKISAEKKSVVDSPVKNAVEEVLHGIKLTKKKLIITVATGGCTGKGNFHIHVDKGYTGLPPYQVTVYQIVSDDCRGDVDPIKISFSRKKLGLEGAIDFNVRNRIGNTSKHRLLP